MNAWETKKNSVCQRLFLRINVITDDHEKKTPKFRRDKKKRNTHFEPEELNSLTCGQEDTQQWTKCEFNEEKKQKKQPNSNQSGWLLIF